MKTAISDMHGNALGIESIVDVAPYFGLKEDEARTLAATMATMIRDEWRQIGASVGMTSADFRAVGHAMRNSQIERAIQFNVVSIPGAAIP